MRSKRATKRQLLPDPLYGSVLVSRLINRVMLDGKKSVAQKQVYKAFEIIEAETGQDPLMVYRTALDNVKPIMEVRARRVGGAAYQVPMPVKTDRRLTLAIRWIVDFANNRPNKEYHSFGEKLAAELIDAANNQGDAIRQKETTHRMAEANQAFAHFAW